VSLTKVSPSLFQVSNNITSVTVGGSANTISLTFDSNGVITDASNNAVSVANTAITGNIISSQIASVSGSVITANTIANSAIQTGAVENYMNAQNLNFGVRNILINGAMQVAQRGTTSTSTGYQTVDRWKVPNMTNQAQLTDAPTGFSNSLEVTGTVVGSSGYGIIDQFIEAKNIAYAVGKTVTLSAYVKNTGTSTVSVSCEIYSANSADTFSSTTLVSSLTSQTITTGWTRIVFPSFSLPAGAANGLQVRIFRYDGSNSQKWQITGVQLEVGTSPTPFEYRSYGTELQLCQRYYYVVASQAAAGNQSVEYGVASFYSATELDAFITFPVSMRTNPTLVQTSGTAYNSVDKSGTALNFSAWAGLARAGVNSGLLYLTSLSGWTAGYSSLVFTNNNSAYIAVSAEL